MRYLLDVNVLIGYGFDEHTFHSRVLSWAESFTRVDDAQFATTPISELGFVRVLSQVPTYGITVEKALHLLARVKETSPVKFTFIPDDHGVSHLPAWVKTAKQTTDGHLAQLAKSNGAILATLDENIPDSFLIPVE
jgi:uncharacterized protein